MEKKKLKYILIVGMLICLGACLAGCVVVKPPIKEINCIDNLNMIVGQTYKLEPEILPETAKENIRFFSNNTTLAIIDKEGTINAIRGGKTDIVVSNKVGTINKNVELSIAPDLRNEFDIKNKIQFFGNEIKPVQVSLNLGVSMIDPQIKWYISKNGADYVELVEARNLTSFDYTPQNQNGLVAKLKYSLEYNYFNENTVYVKNKKFELEDDSALIFGIYEKMETFNLSIDGCKGWFENGDKSYAKLGTEFEIKTNLTGEFAKNIVMDWEMTKTGEDDTFVYANKKSTWSHVFNADNKSADNLIGEYVVVAKINMGSTVVKSEPLTINVSYSDIENLTLTNQFKNIMVGNLETLNLLAQFDEENVNLINVGLKFYYSAPNNNGRNLEDYILKQENNFNVSELDRTCSFDLEEIVGEHKIKVEAYYKNAVINNAYFDTTKRVEVLTIRVNDQFSDLNKVAVTQQNLKQFGTTKKDVEFDAELITSSIANNTLDYHWFVDGVEQDETSSHFVLSKENLSENDENAVWVVYGGMKSEVFTTLNFNNENNGYKEYYENEFIWENSVYNHFISSMKEFVIVMNYIAMTRTDTFKVVFSEKSGISWTNLAGFEKYFAIARSFFDESGIFPYTYSLDQTGNSKVVTLHFNNDSSSLNADAPTKSAKENYVGFNQQNFGLSYENHTGRQSLPIDDADKSMLVKNSNMLARVVSWGVKPIFENEDTNEAKIYAIAREILLSIITDDMTEFEKVRIIYDWLVNEVIYDYALLDLQGLQLQESLKYDGYYLEGVFLKQQGTQRSAVCDGKSKAFELMCGMEGISSVRVAGKAGNGDKLGGHAWNKVLIDVNNDDIKEWMIVDTTWGDIKLSSTGLNNITERKSYSYFLLSENEIYRNEINTDGTHIEKENSYVLDGENFVYEMYPKASNIDFNSFEKIILEASEDKFAIDNPNTEFDCYIETAEEYAAAIAYAMDNEYVEIIFAEGVRSKVFAACTLLDGFLVSNHVRLYDSYGAIGSLYLIYS